MFAGLNAELPLPTRFVIALSNWFVRLLPFLVIGIILGVTAFRRYYATHGGRRVVDKLILKAPIFGPLMQKIAVARFCRTLSTLIASGVPILDGLEITARTAGNRVVEDVMASVIDSVKQGGTIAEPLKSAPVFPGMVVAMVAVGEETGALDAMLSKIADFYEDQVDAAVAGLTSLIEPLLICFLGVIVGFIVISMFLPLITMLDHIN